jgi:predicted nucleic acid-binding protein
MIIVSDSSPLICFAILGMLDVLNDIIEKIVTQTINTWGFTTV